MMNQKLPNHCSYGTWNCSYRTKNHFHGQMHKSETFHSKRDKDAMQLVSNQEFKFIFCSTF